MSRSVLIRQNTTAPKSCSVKLLVWKPFTAPGPSEYGCRLYVHPKSEKHKTYIDGVGWYAFTDKTVEAQRAKAGADK